MARKNDSQPVEAEVTVEDQQAGTSLEGFTDWRSITNVNDYLALIGGQENLVLAHEELGDGFGEIDKADLVGKRLVFVDWSFHVSDKYTRNSEPTEWVRVRGITVEGNRKFWFSDGSEGICRQLRDLTNRTQKREALYCHDGLSRSDYTYTDANGDTSPATTFYVSEGAPI